MSTQSQDLLEALRQPGAYSHDVGTIDVRETHISWVFLTGNFAYKVKKPIRTAFLDYSTLELRRVACFEELRLNRRFAPALYLDVAPVTRSAAGFMVGGTGEPVEYVVRMRQFDESGLLSRMVTEGQLTAQHVDELAKVVGDFHKAAERNPLGSPWGGPEEVVKDAVENLDALKDLPNAAVRRVVDELRGWTNAGSTRLWRVFEQRCQQGFVRECHGDLHLGNLIVWSPDADNTGWTQGHVTPFDGIEFNPVFRWIDIISDLAFAVMDLADRGRPDFAARLLNAWLERTGDYGGLAVLDWYLVYRALVRAKVAVIRAAQAADQPAVAQRQYQEAEQYLSLAQGMTRTSAPRLFITVGVSGSGKSTGTQRLIDSCGVVRIRSDVERKRLAGLDPSSRTESAIADGLYTLEHTSRTYQRLAELSRVIISARKSVVVDATFLKRVERDRFRRLAQELGAEFIILPFEADEQVLRTRVQTRQASGHDPSEAGVDILEYQLKSRESLGLEELPFCRDLAEWLQSEANPSPAAAR